MIIVYKGELNELNSSLLLSGSSGGLPLLPPELVALWPLDDDVGVLKLLLVLCEGLCLLLSPALSLGDALLDLPLPLDGEELGDLRLVLLHLLVELGVAKASQVLRRRGARGHRPSRA